MQIKNNFDIQYERCNQFQMIAQVKQIHNGTCITVGYNSVVPQINNIFFFMNTIYFQKDK